MGVTAKVIQMVDSRESQQTKRFRWRESGTAFWADDTLTGKTHCMGGGVDMFCQAQEDVDDNDTPDCFPVGTQRFYDALNGYFENEQQEIAECYFGVFLPDEEVASNG